MKQTMSREASAAEFITELGNSDCAVRCVVSRGLLCAGSEPPRVSDATFCRLFLPNCCTS